jgi:hypothetical protein
MAEHQHRERAWVHPGTVRDRLDQHGLPLRRAAIRPHRATQRQVVCWAAKRQTRLAGLGFADVEDYLRVRRVEQGSSQRRMLAELQVGSAWLKDQMARLRIPDHSATRRLACRVGNISG